MRYCKLNSELYAAHKLADKLGRALSGMPVRAKYHTFNCPRCVMAMLYHSFIEDRTTTDLISCMLDTLYYLHEYGIRCYAKPHVRGVTVFTRLHKDEKYYIIVNGYSKILDQDSWIMEIQLLGLENNIQGAALFATN